MDKYTGRKTDLYVKKQIKRHTLSVENSRKDLGHDLHDSKKCSFCVGNDLNLNHPFPIDESEIVKISTKDYLDGTYDLTRLKNFQRDPERIHDSYGPCNVKGKKKMATSAVRT